jgi:hypothetical protein
MRSALVAALIGCVELPLKARTRQFLRGLSYDELQFIAEYLGAKILETACGGCGLTNHRRTEDAELKMILLLEYLGFAGLDAQARQAGPKSSVA